MQAQKAYWIGRLFTHKKGDFETTSVTAEQSCDAPISKEESHISDRIFGHFTTILDYFRRFLKATEDPRRMPTISEEELRGPTIAEDAVRRTLQTLNSLFFGNSKH